MIWHSYAYRRGVSFRRRNCSDWMIARLRGLIKKLCPLVLSIQSDSFYLCIYSFNPELIIYYLFTQEYFFFWRKIKNPFFVSEWCKLVMTCIFLFHLGMMSPFCVLSLVTLNFLSFLSFFFLPHPRFLKWFWYLHLFESLIVFNFLFRCHTATVCYMCQGFFITFVISGCQWCNRQLCTVKVP